jgi:hypothetical protein
LFERKHDLRLPQIHLQAVILMLQIQNALLRKVPLDLLGAELVLVSYKVLFTRFKASQTSLTVHGQLCSGIGEKDLVSSTPV